MLPSSSTQAHKYPYLKSASLLSIRKQCDSNYSALFTAKYVTIFNSDKTSVPNGIRNTSDGLWDVTVVTSQPKPPLTATITQHTIYLLRLDKTKSQLASYLHAAAGCPTKSTSIQAINNGNFITWPGLTSKLISKHLPLSLPTLKGRLSQQHQNIRSTKRNLNKKEN